MRGWRPLRDECPECFIGTTHPALWELTLQSGPRSIHAVICRNGKCDHGEILSMRDKTTHAEALRVAARWRWVAKVEAILLLLALAAIAALVQVASF